MREGHRPGRRRAGGLPGVALLAAVLLGGCGSDPTAGGSAPDAEAEAVALVRAERLIAGAAPGTRPIGEGGGAAPAAFDRLALGGRVAPLVDLPAPAGLGRQPQAWVASFVADGAWRLVFKAETGPCIIDCAGQRYWYFTVSPLGEPQPAGTYVVLPGTAHTEGESRWGFPGDGERRLVAAARAATR